MLVDAVDIDWYRASRNRPIESAAYVPSIPEHLPFSRTYADGDEGLTVDWRMREHWTPSSVWKGLTSTVPPVRHPHTLSGCLSNPLYSLLKLNLSAVVPDVSTKHQLP